MEEEIKDSELENIMKEINENLSKKVVSSRKKEDGLFVVFRDDIKYAKFQGEFGKKARSMKELKPLLDYLWKNGYNSNLD